jgi:hypothetical protein
MLKLKYLVEMEVEKHKLEFVYEEPKPADVYNHP